MGNGKDGIRISGSHSTIGGFDPRRSTANTIAYNGGDGVHVFGSLISNSVRGNSIFENTGLGIDIAPDGVNQNDHLDADSGPNLLQNAPNLVTAWTTGTGTVVRLKFHSAPGGTYHIDFYVNDQVDNSGHGEGATCLGTHTVTTPLLASTLIADVNLPFVPVGKFITATATDLFENTSEFSDALEVKARSLGRR